MDMNNLHTPITKEVSGIQLGIMSPDDIHK